MACYSHYLHQNNVTKWSVLISVDSALPENGKGDNNSIGLSPQLQREAVDSQQNQQLIQTVPAPSHMD